MQRQTCLQASLDGECSKVWWIQGSLSAFPVHAAGLHFKGSTNKVLDSEDPDIGRKRGLEKSTWLRQSPRRDDGESPTDRSLEGTRNQLRKYLSSA